MTSTHQPAVDLSVGEHIDSVLKACSLSASKFAEAIGMSPQAVSFMRAGTRSVPADKVPLICQMSGETVRRWHLRPDDWHRIWPELVNTEGAPPVPAAEPAQEVSRG